MNTFRHHPDGWIYINSEQIRLEDFLTLEPEYSLPEGYIGREYKQGKENRVFTDMSETFLELEWAEGDYYISKLEEYKLALASYISA